MSKTPKQFKKYRKYCQTGHHYVNHLVKRYYIIAKWGENHQPTRVPKLGKICRQCASYTEEWTLTLNKARMEVYTRNLLQGGPT